MRNSPVKVNNHEFKDFEFRNDTLRKLLNPLKEIKYVSTQLLTCCVGLYYPWNIHVKEWEKLKKLLRVLASFQSQELGALPE